MPPEPSCSCFTAHSAVWYQGAASRRGPTTRARSRRRPTTRAGSRRGHTSRASGPESCHQEEGRLPSVPSDLSRWAIGGQPRSRSCCRVDGNNHWRSSQSSGLFSEETLGLGLLRPFWGHKSRDAFLLGCLASSVARASRCARDTRGSNSRARLARLIQAWATRV